MAIDFSFLRERTPEIIGEQETAGFAVIIPVLESPGGPELLFEIRSEKLAHQPGDICFPGGRVESGETPAEAAVREICEELLVVPPQVELIGPADVLRGGNRQIHSFVCYLKGYEGRFGRDEVAEVFTVPLQFFLENDPEIHTVSWKPQFGEDFPFGKIHGGREYPWRTQEDQIFFYEFDGRVIWGMTAKIVKSFADLVRRHNEDADRKDTQVYNH